MSFQELDMISIGNFMDMITKHFKMKTPPEEQVREATQADVNKFLKA